MEHFVKFHNADILDDITTLTLCDDLTGDIHRVFKFRKCCLIYPDYVISNLWFCAKTIFCVL